MKLIEIFHRANPDFRVRNTMPDDLEKVASFRTDLPTDNALEDAFRRTQNIDSAWDECPGIEAEPGRHRSTSVGDVVKVDGMAFQCAPVGWKRFEV